MSFVPPNETPPETSAPNVNQLLATALRHYHNGEYQEAIHLLSNILAIDPQHKIAREYFDKAVLDLAKGVVPLKRIPPDALQARQRGHSQQVSGNYAEARRFFELARSIASSSGINLWNEIEDDLALLENLVRQRAEFQGIQALAAEGNLEQALALMDNFPAAASNADTNSLLDFLRKAVNCQERLNEIETNPAASAQDNLNQLILLKMDLSQLRFGRMENPRLAQLEGRLGEVAEIHIERLVNRANQLVRGPRQGDVEPRLASLNKLVKELESAARLAPDEYLLETLSNETHREIERLSQVSAQYGEIAQAISQNRDVDLVRARHMLLNLRDAAGDTRFRAFAMNVQQQLFDRAQVAGNFNRPAEMRHWLSLGDHELLDGPGSAAQSEQLKAQLAAIEKRLSQRKWFITLGVTASVVVMVVLVVTIGYFGFTIFR